MLEDGDAHAVMVAQRPTGRRFRIAGAGVLADRLRQALPVAEPATDLVVVAEPAQGLGAACRDADPALRLWLVRGQSEADAALGGAFAALSLDRPDSIGSAIELTDESEASIRALVLEVQDHGLEDRVRIVAGERLAARLVPRTALPAEAPPVRADRLYVIAGGLGMLGTAFAGWLVEQGARHLLLVGRRGGVTAAVETWRRRGAEVRVAALDLTAAAAAADLGALIDRPLGGMVHAAGAAAGEPATLVASKLAIARTLATVASGHEPRLPGGTVVRRRRLGCRATIRAMLPPTRPSTHGQRKRERTACRRPAWPWAGSPSAACWRRRTTRRLPPSACSLCRWLRCAAPRWMSRLRVARRW